MDILLTTFVNSIINDLEYLELLKLDEFLNTLTMKIFTIFI